MRPIPGTVTDPSALRRALEAAERREKREGYIVTGPTGAIYHTSKSRGASDAECAYLIHQGVECWVVPVDDLEVE